jgi:hypothetical protein
LPWLKPTTMHVSIVTEYQLHLRGLAYIVKIDPTGAGCGGWSAFPLQLDSTGVRTPGSIPITDGSWTVTSRTNPQRSTFSVSITFGCSLGTFSVAIRLDHNTVKK